jgi:hypothetical protein
MMVRRLLPLLILLAAPLANAEPACVGHFFLPADASTFNVTCSGYGTPVGTIFTGNYALSVDTDTVHAFKGLGFTDYTTDGWHVGTSEDAQAATDSCDENNVDANFEWSSAGACLQRRNITAATTTDGITVTPNNSTEQYGGIAVNLHADDCVAFSTGNGTTSGSTFAVAHGLASTPDFGVFSYSANTAGQSSQSKVSYGVFWHNAGSHVQKAYAQTWQDNQVDGESHGRLFSDRVGGVTNNGSGAESQSIELTGNDGTNTTFTARTATLSGDLTGILCITTANVWAGNLTSPNSAGSDWTVTDPSFQAGFVLSVLTNMTAEDTTVTDSEAAGNIGLFVTDFTNEKSASAASENGDPGDGNSNTMSRIDGTGLYFPDHDHTADYDLDTVTATASGFQVVAADITTADATSHLWPTLIIEADAAAASGILLRRRHN